MAAATDDWQQPGDHRDVNNTYTKNVSVSPPTVRRPNVCRLVLRYTAARDDDDTAPAGDDTDQSEFLGDDCDDEVGFLGQEIEMGLCPRTAPLPNTPPEPIAVD
jgi:hypothetical protein